MKSNKIPFDKMLLFEKVHFLNNLILKLEKEHIKQMNEFNDLCESLDVCDFIDDKTLINKQKRIFELNIQAQLLNEDIKRVQELVNTTRSELCN